MRSYVKLGCNIEEEGCTNKEPGGKSTYIGIREAREITKKLSGGWRMSNEELGGAWALGYSDFHNLMGFTSKKDAK